MKRFFYFSMMAIAMMMFACSTSSSTPSDALLEYVDLLKAGKYEKFVEGMAFKEGLTQEQIQEQKASGPVYYKRKEPKNMKNWEDSKVLKSPLKKYRKMETVPSSNSNKHLATVPPKTAVKPWSKEMVNG